MSFGDLVKTGKFVDFSYGCEVQSIVKQFILLQHDYSATELAVQETRQLIIVVLCFKSVYFVLYRPL